MLSQYRFVITCEHASPDIPDRWKSLLGPFCETCEPHQLWDPGAVEIGAHLANMLEAPFFKGEQTRLLVDLNRSPHHPTLFSSPVQELPDSQRTHILTTHYYPFRHEMIRLLDTLVTEDQPIIHLSVHSFTPHLNGESRDADFGLLYDPDSLWEREAAELELYHLQIARPELVCRANYPYLGTDDGHVTALRLAFGRHRYLGLELEFNQKLPLVEEAEGYARWICQSLRRTLSNKRFAPLLASSPTVS
ncbi:MAG: N-formylglutamate amidohydrolase [Opitutales bacterium]